MKMKNMLIGGMSLALVACISVGGTLAYLHSKTDTITNTFTVGAGYDGNVLTLDETKVIMEGDVVKENPTAIGGEGNRTSADQTYAPINIGDQFVKDPTFHVKANSASSYVFAKVTGMDEMIQKEFVVGTLVDGKITAGVDKNAWERVADEDGNPVEKGDKSYDGYYIYKGTKSTDGVIATSTGAIDLEALFTYIELPTTVESMPNMEDNNTIDVAGAIIQSEHLNKSTALTEVLKIEGFGTTASAKG